MAINRGIKLATELLPLLPRLAVPAAVTPHYVLLLLLLVLAVMQLAGLLALALLLL
jgi:hypothetical protein